MRSMRTISSVLICGLLLIPQPVYAKSAPAGMPGESADVMPQWEKNVHAYADLCNAKLDYGAPNVMTGWTALFREPSKSVSKQSGIRKKTGAFFQGALVGLTLATSDTAFGLLNVLTAPIAVKIPIPGGGVSIDHVTGAKPPAPKPASAQTPAGKHSSGKAPAGKPA